MARRGLEVRVRRDLASGVRSAGISALVDLSSRKEAMIVYRDENDFDMSLCDTDVRTNLDIESCVERSISGSWRFGYVAYLRRCLCD